LRDGKGGSYCYGNGLGRGYHLPDSVPSNDYWGGSYDYGGSHNLASSYFGLDRDIDFGGNFENKLPNGEILYILLVIQEAAEGIYQKYGMAVIHANYLNSWGEMVRV
jgi:hypothetical protein